jgi:uncharacterized protein (DUF1800 family)
MRERVSFRRISISLFARRAARLVPAVLATFGLVSGSSASAATTTTSFQFAYMYGTSGPSGGGTAVNIVGNQFAPGATVTIGGQTVVASVTNSTRISATTPNLTPGALYDVIVTNPTGPPGVLTRGWFADFTDVQASSPFHAPVETIVRDGITSGCGGGNYCASSAVTRAQMAVFLLRAGHGSSYIPPPATGTVFADVMQSDFAADWIEQLYAEGVTGGCNTNPLRYCPTFSVTRGQMAAFLLKIYHGAGYAPPAATGIFSDVPVSMPLAPWIEEMGRLYITVGCGGTSYCPNNPVTRGQMAVFLAKTFRRSEGARFLEQATWGPKDSEISALLGVGYLPWLTSQYGLTPSTYPNLPLVPDNQPGTCDVYCRRDNYSAFPHHTQFFRNAMYQPDQLRQRVFFALHKLDVISSNTITRPSQMAPYLNLLVSNTFGNYRTILEQITLNPAMGAFLNTSTSTQNNPNENYAREVMQLFSIGTELLNQDGSTQNDVISGLPLPSYDQSVIDNLKRVFTGWYIPQVSVTLLGDTDDTGDYLNPMVQHKNGSMQEDRHDTTAKDLFLGFLPNQNGDGAPTVIPAGQTGDQDLQMALDAIFSHPNVGPYLSRELIHSLVTSNPSPAYIERVAGFFNDDGTSQRGSLWAMVKAVLLDPEARNAPSDPTYGKLKEPALYITSLLRGFNALSANRAQQSDGYVNSPWSRDMGQDVFRPTTVFSYFPQDYHAPPASAGLFGPEFGIMDASTSLKRANFFNQMLFNGGIAVNCGTNSCNAPNGTSIDVSELQQLAGTPANLVDRLNRLMMHGTMSDEMKNSIAGAVNAVPSTNTLLRARQALYLVATASQYQVQR